MKTFCLKTFLFIPFSFLIFSCTTNYKQPIHDFEIPQINDKLNMPIELIITDDFRNAKWQMHRMGSTTEEKLGDNLVYNTEKMMNNIFTNVKYSYNPNNNLLDDTERYLMIPKFVYFGHATGVSLFSETKTSVTVRWEIVRKTGEYVWAETITGTYVGTYKQTSLENNFQQFYKEALLDLFQKSQEEILASNLLRSLQ